MTAVSMKPWLYPTLFAHRGGGSMAPENTVAAMKAGHAHGYTAVEFDVKLSQDGMAILMHDDTLERTTNGRGLVCEKPVSELESLDAGAWHSEIFRGECIPRLAAVAKYLQSVGIRANVEIKACPGREQETGRIVAELCDELWQDDNMAPLVSSFSIASLRAARKAVPALPIGFLVGSANEAQIDVLDELGAVSLHCHHNSLTIDLVRFFHRHQYRVLAYTVNEPPRAVALLEMNVDGMFTDNLAALAQQFPHFLADSVRPFCDQVWGGNINPQNNGQSS